MVVPSFSPPLILEDTRSLSNTPVPEIQTGRSSPSETSSSCGSYSVDGSCPDLLERSKVPSASSVKPACSEDERARYVSPIYHEDGEESRKTSGRTKRRPFTLEITKHQDALNTSKIGKNDKVKRVKARTKSPMQVQKKHYQIKKVEESKATSDESSCDFSKYSINQTSPRKNKKLKETNRRKSLPRSPTGQRTKKNNHEEKPSSLPGSLSRRKSSKNRNLQTQEETKSTLGLYSSEESPKKRSSPQRSPENATLKALSAESLRSVSPGSDSVFYSDPNIHSADHQVHCLHCGKEVDIVTTDDTDETICNTVTQQVIVQPPAGFEDSPRTKHPPGRLYKKLDRRFRSEDRGQNEYRRHRYKQDARAKVIYFSITVIVLIIIF